MCIRDRCGGGGQHPDQSPARPIRQDPRVQVLRGQDWPRGGQASARARAQSRRDSLGPVAVKFGMALPESVVGVLLAGGKSSRMGGGDKCLRVLGGKPILARIIDRLSPQVSDIVINANGDPARFAAFGLPVVSDSVAGYQGPVSYTHLRAHETVLDLVC